MQKQIVFLFFICLSFSQLIGQEVKKEDTLRYYIANHELFDQFDSVVFSNLDGFQFYRPFGKRRLPLAENGNIGLPVHSFLSQSQQWNANHLIGAYQPYVLSADSMHFYQASDPLTIFNYTNGSEKEQFFTAFHTQNIGEGLNIGFRYDKFNSEGFFTRQQTNHSRFNATYHLQSRNKQFQSRGFYTINTLEAFENGGVFVSDESGSETTAILLDINMFDAQNRSRSREIEFLNSYGWGKNQSDERIVSIFHRINWQKVSRNFDNLTSSSSGYYENFYIDTARTYDTMSVFKFSNQFGFGIADRLHFFYEFNNYNYFQNFIVDEELYSNSIGFAYEDTLLNHRIEIDAKKGVSGYYQEDLDLKAKITAPVTQGFSPFLIIGYRKAVADYFVSKQRANNYFYDLSFNTSNTFAAEFILMKMEWDALVSVSYEDYGNLIYYDSLVLPKQLNNNIQVIKLRLQKEFTFLKNLHFNSKLVYQLISEEEILPLPDLVGYHSFYYENRLFKKSLRVQIGFDYSWSSSYLGYAYDPAMVQYHLRSSNQMLSGVNQLDFFMNLGITKSARLFVKYENLLFPNYDQKSIRIENYPVPGRALKFGLSWRMVN